MWSWTTYSEGRVEEAVGYGGGYGTPSTRRDVIQAEEQHRKGNHSRKKHAPTHRPRAARSNARRREKVNAARLLSVDRTAQFD